jgi:hypothetical protein
MMRDPIQWLLESDEPWTRCCSLVDLLDHSDDAPEVQAARADMLAHSQVRELITQDATWANPLFVFTTGHFS